jgi:MYXO-CTERM domain-containing protein
VCMSNICVAGTCVATAPVDAGSPDSGAGDAGRGDAGRPASDGGRDSGKDSGKGSGHVSERGDAAITFPEEPTSDASVDGSLAETPGVAATGSGCACRTTPSGSNQEGILWLLASLGVLLSRRRRTQ